MPARRENSVLCQYVIVELCYYLTIKIYALKTKVTSSLRGSEDTPVMFRKLKEVSSTQESGRGAGNPECSHSH